MRTPYFRNRFLPIGTHNSCIINIWEKEINKRTTNSWHNIHILYMSHKGVGEEEEDKHLPWSIFPLMCAIRGIIHDSIRGCSKKKWSSRSRMLNIGDWSSCYSLYLWSPRFLFRALSSSANTQVSPFVLVGNQEWVR